MQREKYLENFLEDDIREYLDDLVIAENFLGQTMKKGLHIWMGFPGGSGGKESACCVEDQGSIPGLGRSLGEGNGYPLQ